MTWLKETVRFDYSRKNSTKFLYFFGYTQRHRVVMVALVLGALNVMGGSVDVGGSFVLALPLSPLVLSLHRRSRQEFLALAAISAFMPAETASNIVIQSPANGCCIHPGFAYLSRPTFDV